jgi:hypothetical protein
MKNNSYIKQILELNESLIDRKEFHTAVGKLLPKMGSDKLFWNEVFKMNLSDKGYLSRQWTMYEIPFFYVYECDDFFLKVHLFCPLQSYEKNVLASTIHHHNNYMLTTFAAYGSGYETFLFEKNPITNEETKETKLKITMHFTQKDMPVHLIDAWEPHCVVNPETLSATLNFWSPDKKRTTDKLRGNPLLKFFKTPLRKVIYLLGLDKTVGIAAKNTYQWYPYNGKFIGVLEDDYFAPTRAESGAIVDDYSIQTVFYFLQKMGFDDFDFLKKMLTNPDVPPYYHKWINMFIEGKEISVTYAKATINVPNKTITVKEVIETDKIINK